MHGAAGVDAAGGDGLAAAARGAAGVAGGLRMFSYGHLAASAIALTMLLRRDLARRTCDAIASFSA